jgi:hypothetical protein
VSSAIVTKSRIIRAFRHARSSGSLEEAIAACAPLGTFLVALADIELRG